MENACCLNSLLDLTMIAERPSRTDWTDLTWLWDLNYEDQLSTPVPCSQYPADLLIYNAPSPNLGHISYELSIPSNFLFLMGSGPDQSHQRGNQPQLEAADEDESIASINQFLIKSSSAPLKTSSKVAA